MQSVSIYGKIDASGVDLRPIEVDASSHAITTVDYPHHEMHEGDHYFVTYSVPSLGAMTTPDDTLTLSFTTPNTTKWSHFTFTAEGPSGALVQLIEGKTGGGASSTGALTIMNNNRNSANTSAMINLEGSPAAGSVSYDATVFTGGTTIWSKYIPGATNGIVGSGLSGTRNEIILKQNTSYQLSIFSTTTNPASLEMNWYEHTDED